MKPEVLEEHETDPSFAAESPEFVTVSVTWNDSPTLTGADGTVNAADNAAGYDFEYGAVFRRLIARR